jgi:hypothetical protein
MPPHLRASRRQTISRRTFVAGSAAAIGASAFPYPASAFWAAVLEGIDALVTLWSGYKMVKEIYDEFFAGRQQAITNEASRVYGSTNFIVNNYYRFDNPYNVRALSAAEPGCDLYPPSIPDAAALCCGTQNEPVFLSTGCIVALRSAAQDLQSSWGVSDVFAYTRPIRYVTAVEPWQAIDPYGVQLKSDVEYYSPSGSVALRWLITNRQARTCKGEYLIRDDNSLRVVADGSTPEFYF